MKKYIFLIVSILCFGSIGFCEGDITNLEEIGANTSTDAKPAKQLKLDKDTVYYPNASVKSAVEKYKVGNYTGCMQELFSVLKNEPSNATAYYYLALTYTKVNMKNDAIDSYNQVIGLSPNSYLADYAQKGKDCLESKEKCAMYNKVVEDDEDTVEEVVEEKTDLDKFIEAPYGNGLSPELNLELKQKELKNIKETINQNDSLNRRDVDKIREFDKNNNMNSVIEHESYIEDDNRIAQVSDEEVLKAIKTLRDAGVTVNVSTNPYGNGYQDPQMAELSMMLGNNNNNNNTGNMMNMLPMLMANNQDGKNLDPRLIQAMMMNSMMTDFTFSNNNNNRY